jgi:hypothetical protein
MAGIGKPEGEGAGRESQLLSPGAREPAQTGGDPHIVGGWFHASDSWLRWLRGNGPSRTRLIQARANGAAKNRRAATRHAAENHDAGMRRPGRRHAARAEPPSMGEKADGHRLPKGTRDQARTGDASVVAEAKFHLPPGCEGMAPRSESCGMRTARLTRIRPATMSWRFSRQSGTARRRRWRWSGC